MATVQATLNRGGRKQIIPWYVPEFYEIKGKKGETETSLLSTVENNVSGKYNVNRIKYSNFNLIRDTGKVTTIGTYVKTYIEENQTIRDLFARAYEGDTSLEQNKLIDIDISDYDFPQITVAKSKMALNVGMLKGYNEDVKSVIQYKVTFSSTYRIINLLIPVEIISSNGLTDTSMIIVVNMYREINKIEYNICISDLAFYNITTLDSNKRFIFGTCPISPLYNIQFVQGAITQLNAQYNHDNNNWAFTYDLSGQRLKAYDPSIHNITDYFENSYYNLEYDHYVDTSINFNMYNVQQLTGISYGYTYNTQLLNVGSSLYKIINYAPMYQYQSNYGTENTWEIVGLDLSDPVYAGQSNDPNAPTPQPGGGNGSYEGDRETIGVSPKPVDVGNWQGSRTLYYLTPAQSQSFINYLMGGNVQETWSKFQSEPNQYIVSFATTWLPIPEGADQNIHFAGVDTGVGATYIRDNIVELEYGPFTATHYYDNFLDYSPYSAYQIYLPFVGFKDLEPEDVFIEGGLKILYRCNLITGAGICYIIGNDTVLYTYPCRLNSQEPLSAQDFSQKYFNVLKTVAGVGATVGGIATGNVPLAVGGAVTAITSGVSSFKPPTVQRISEQDVGVNLLENREPYLIITRPTRFLPEDFGHLYGYKCNMTKKLGECRGFTKVENINPHITKATEKEVIEIKDWLQKGVYIYNNAK